MNRRYCLIATLLVMISMTTGCALFSIDRKVKDALDKYLTAEDVYQRSTESRPAEGVNGAKWAEARDARNDALKALDSLSKE